MNWLRQYHAEGMVLSAALRTGPELQTAYEMGSYSGDRRTLQRAMKFLEDVNGEIEKLIRQQWAHEIRQRSAAEAAA